MILKLLKEINRKDLTVRSDYAFMRYIGFSHVHSDIFSYFGKEFLYSV